MITPEKIEGYVLKHTSKEDSVLASLNRETYASVSMPQMLSGVFQGRLLELISRALRPLKILEIGTYTGYSAICMAKGLQPGGKLITIDINDELEDMARRYFKQAGVDEQIKRLSGNALEIIPTLNEQFDLVFIDADKVNYPRYYSLVVEKVRPGGIILADNVLWNGDVLKDMKDKRTRALDAFNKMVTADERVSNCLLPVRDGLMWIARL